MLDMLILVIAELLGGRLALTIVYKNHECPQLTALSYMQNLTLI